jgi:hypothetical protein
VTAATLNFEAVRLGDEECPATASLRDAILFQITRKLRLLDDARPWSSFTDTQCVGVLLGNSPPSLLKKHIKSWMKECVPQLHSHATELRASLDSLKDPSPLESEDNTFDSTFNEEVRRAMTQHSP